MQFTIQRWIRISIFNLMLVASIGVILRYKIAFALPFIDQKHLLHGHSHFAFAGWITQALMVLMVSYLASRLENGIVKKYGWLLFANLFTAYGMLVSFIIEGYGPYSILFSTLSVFVSYAFAIVFWIDLNKDRSKNSVHLWFKAALAFNALSSFGAFALAGMMVNKVIHQNWYLAAEYFYLHFQYNGWFFFACMGLFTSRYIQTAAQQIILKKIFRLFFIAVIPAYLLSVLWMNFSLWIYIIIVVAAILQVFSWGWFLALIKPQMLFIKQTSLPATRWLLTLSAIALSIKLLLQLGSVIPSLSNIAYGFRPIIIGYLHLVLLGVISVFLLGYMTAEKYLNVSQISKYGMILFVGGIILNELFLMVQGFTAMNYTYIPFINESLFIITLIMLTGIVTINVSQQRKNLH